MQGAGLDYLKGQTNVFSEHRQEEASYYFTSEGSHDSFQNVSTGFEDLVEDTIPGRLGRESPLLQ